MTQPAVRKASFGAAEDFAARAGAPRRWRSSVDSGETIRADRDRGQPGATSHAVDAGVVVSRTALSGEKSG